MYMDRATHVAPDPPAFMCQDSLMSARRPRHIPSALYTHLANSNQCVYCGAPAEVIDHFTPVSFVTKLLEFINLQTKLWTVDSCAECNALASDEVFETFELKQRYIQAKLAKRYQSRTKVRWTEEELAELSGWLHDYVAGADARARELELSLRSRLKWKPSNNPCSADLANVFFIPRGSLVPHAGYSVVPSAEIIGTMKLVGRSSPGRRRLAFDREFTRRIIAEFGEAEGRRIVGEVERMERQAAGQRELARSLADRPAGG